MSVSVGAGVGAGVVVDVVVAVAVVVAMAMAIGVASVVVRSGCCLVRDYPLLVHGFVGFGACSHSGLSGALLPKGGGLLGS